MNKLSKQKRRALLTAFVLITAFSLFITYVKKWNATMANSLYQGTNERNYGNLLLDGMSVTNDGINGYTVSASGGGACSTWCDSGTYTIQIHNQGTADWHIQFYQAGLNLKEGSIYKISYSIKSDVEKTITTNLQESHDSWEKASEEKTKLTKDKLTTISYMTDPLVGDPDRFYIGLGLCDTNFDVGTHTVVISDLQIVECQ